MRERKNYITEDTMITIDEEIFKILAQELVNELFVEYVNEKYGYAVLELKK